ncbi:malto-oligosyltrehalose synthase [Arthrobacter caoxuetaonis]|uniref:Malto-oligosyltrehalose synthase n=1 Tax=Arthrobacter caoxuetaonis TaxID=2886935 RepID=A0A9X1MAR4_9MICC|nr:malto-oligosyltrehalose synthase [Arthrobacter caoxuetaonis]MCC3296598.1 malto-oligosyltrehalose synthase [Arthrobacter caoxuetaonis]USQ56574.1 malto-oligosyltrehalose synthase [Arthrobacter caoxuetaonis]
MRAPRSTYRLQLHEDFTLFDAAALVPYLRDLGVDWVYLSPLLKAEEGSTHGYDVTDPSCIDPARGGPEGFQALADAAHGAGMGVLVDIVPNHMGVATPRANQWWWSVLRDGPESRYAEAFDIDWAAGNGKLRLPVLGDNGDALDELRIEDGELRYHEQAFPLAEGTFTPGDSARQVHSRQHYELVNWRRADNELNYRRFFGVNTLAGVRVEVPWVFEESHAEIRRWFQEGLADGLRIDHPDGLADPAGYLEQLRELTGGAYVLVEKILEPGEKLPASWSAAGTTGYDALAEVDRLFVDPEAAAALTDASDAEPYRHMIHDTKRAVADGLLHSEVQRLVRLLPPGSGLEAETAADALAELLACFPVYRSYLPEGAGYLDEAALNARVRRPDLEPAIEVLLPLLQGQGGDGEDGLGELAVRFQQTSGMVMAKGVEDTAFYRYTRLTSLNEVGADPSLFAMEPHDLHLGMMLRQQEAPDAMTTLSTHDTKRSEDTRARISVLTEMPQEWTEAAAELAGLLPLEDRPLAELVWQALVGTWPLERSRAHAYAEKAAREAGDSTMWTAPDEAFEKQLHALVDGAYDHPKANAVLEAVVDRIRGAGYSNALGAKLVQLTMPGVPDVYQGTELWDHSLVDPDNRRPVDFEARRTLLSAVSDLSGEDGLPEIDESGAAKLLVTREALRLRRDKPALFTGYSALVATGAAAGHFFGFDRGGVLTAVTRLPLGLERAGGWQDTTVQLPSGTYRDALSGAAFTGAAVKAAELFAQYPVALLVREEDA